VIDVRSTSLSAHVAVQPCDTVHVDLDRVGSPGKPARPARKVSHIVYGQTTEHPGGELMLGARSLAPRGLDPQGATAAVQSGHQQLVELLRVRATDPEISLFFNRPEPPEQAIQ